ncbi:MAG: hypothetical protein MHPSP_002003, partial [Paramarteilia canceri]
MTQMDMMINFLQSDVEIAITTHEPFADLTNKLQSDNSISNVIPLFLDVKDWSSILLENNGPFKVDISAITQIFESRVSFI